MVELLVLLLLIAGLVCFGIRAFRKTESSWDLTALGLAFWILTVIIGRF
jgi:uncharacterized membrane protein